MSSANLHIATNYAMVKFMNHFPAQGEVLPDFESVTPSFPGAHVTLSTFDISAPNYSMAFVLPTVGVLNASVDTITSPNTLKIEEVVVRGQMRGEGFGTMLLEWALQDARSRGLLIAELHIINSLVIGSIQGLLDERQITDASYLRKKNNTNIFKLPLTDVFISPDRITAAEARQYIREAATDDKPIVRAAIHL